MALGGRDLSRIARAVVRPRHYAAVFNILRTVERPFDTLRRYLFAYGDYPIDVGVRTPPGPIRLTLYSYHDMLTLNEVFCRRDYPPWPEDRVLVDWGSNIGVSAAYFLTRGDGTVYCFEPLPMNLKRLEHNLHTWKDRVRVHPVAVGPQAGQADFGYEATGRWRPGPPTRGDNSGGMRRGGQCA